jgi:hypothetical protein
VSWWKIFPAEMFQLKMFRYPECATAGRYGGIIPVVSKVSVAVCREFSSLSYKDTGNKKTAFFIVSNHR